MKPGDRVYHPDRGEGTLERKVKDDAPAVWGYYVKFDGEATSRFVSIVRAVKEGAT